jgi:hypothetical protein
VHYEVERFVEFFRPSVWVALSRDETGRVRRFPDREAAERAAQRWQQPGAKRIVLVQPDGTREVIAEG